MLDKDDQIIAANLVALRKPIEPDELICLTIEAKRKQYDGEVHLVVPPNSRLGGQFTAAHQSDRRKRVYLGPVKGDGILTFDKRRLALCHAAVAGFRWVSVSYTAPATDELKSCMSDAFVQAVREPLVKIANAI